MHRLRVKYEKVGVGIFLAHLEVMRALERALRRADFPFILSKGYSPRPRISYAPPLPVGYESFSEYLDVLLARRLSRIEAGQALKESLPQGFNLVDLKFVSLESPSLMQLSSLGLYQVKLKDDDLDFKMANLLEKVFEEYSTRDEIIYSYRGKEMKLKREDDYPLTRFDKETFTFTLLLATGSRRTVRPEVFLGPVFEKLSYTPSLRISRMALYFRRGGKLLDLMEA